jgi:hypothetical protein
MEKVSKEEIRKLLLERSLELTDVIDEIIELNHIIGVGLITLGDNTKDYIYSKITPSYE